MCGNSSLSVCPGIRPSYVRHLAGVRGQQCRWWVSAEVVDDSEEGQRTWPILFLICTRCRVSLPKT